MAAGWPETRKKAKPFWLPETLFTIYLQFFHPGLTIGSSRLGRMTA
jgi:hypothetical protein